MSYVNPKTLKSVSQRNYTEEANVFLVPTKEVPESINSMIFVFGSNLAGLHMAGAAKDALTHKGAIWGNGEGVQGNSYALPTKDWSVQTLSLKEIQHHVNKFIEFCKKNSHKRFQVTQVGCGLAGMSPQDIAPMFKEAPLNCYFDSAWKDHLPDDFKYWGTK